MFCTTTFTEFQDKSFNRTLFIKSQQIIFSELSSSAYPIYASSFFCPLTPPIQPSSTGFCCHLPEQVWLAFLPHSNSSLSFLVAWHFKEAIPCASATESYFLVGEKEPELVSSKLSWPEEGPKKRQYKAPCRGKSTDWGYISHVNTRGLFDWHTIIISNYRNEQNDCWTLELTAK